VLEIDEEYNFLRNGCEIINFYSKFIGRTTRYDVGKGKY